MNDVAVQRVSRRSPVFCGLTLDWAHGRCAWFALAAAKHYSLPLVGFFTESGDSSAGPRLTHVACATDSGLFDAYGFGTPDQVKASFRELGQREEMWNRLVTVDQVKAAFELAEPEHEQEIEEALHVVQRLMLELAIGPLQAPKDVAASPAPRRVHRMK